MNQPLKKYISLLLLVLFLYPTATEWLHNYAHKDDVTCTQTGLHFHPTEHHCVIDDFLFYVSDIPPDLQITVHFTTELLRYIFSYLAPAIYLAYKCHFSLRGPPIIK